jgi:hypothetical protein
MMHNLQEGDVVLLLCSDGIYDHVSNAAAVKVRDSLFERRAATANTDAGCGNCRAPGQTSGAGSRAARCNAPASIDCNLAPLQLQCVDLLILAFRCIAHATLRE